MIVRGCCASEAKMPCPQHAKDSERPEEAKRPKGKPAGAWCREVSEAGKGGCLEHRPKAKQCTL